MKRMVLSTVFGKSEANDEEYSVNPWSLGLSFMVQKMAINLHILVF